MRAERGRILVLIKGLGLGGAERLIADASRVWDRRSFEYAVAYVLPWKDQLAQPIAEQGIEVRCIGGKRGLDLATPIRLRRMISDFGADIVHAHLPSAGVLARLTTSVPIVYTEHNIAGSYRQPTRLLNWITYARNDKVVAVSDAVARSLDGYPGPATTVISNGITVEEIPEARSDVRAELGIGDDRPLVTHVGNFRPHKGHYNLIAATALLKESVPEVLVASIGAEKNPGDLDAARREAESRHAADNIRFLGRRDDARRFLAAADVVVNPSDVEGLPVSLLEAMSYSRPVVATDVGGVSKVVINEETGLLVPPGEPEILAKAMERALTDPSAGAWGETGRELVHAHHGMAAMVDEYESLYAEVL